MLKARPDDPVDFAANWLQQLIQPEGKDEQERLTQEYMGTLETAINNAINDGVDAGRSVEEGLTLPNLIDALRALRPSRRWNTIGYIRVHARGTVCGRRAPDPTEHA
jgi:hypothetical protein